MSLTGKAPPGVAADVAPPAARSPSPKRPSPGLPVSDAGAGGGGDRAQVLSPGVEEERGVGVAQEVNGEEELRVRGRLEQAHAGVLQCPVPLVEVAPEARRHHVGPRGGAAPRPRYHVIDGEPIAPPAAVLASVVIPSQDVLLVEGDPLDEGLPDVDGEANDGRQREAVGGRSDHARRRLDTLGFATEEEGDGPAGVGEVERLEAAGEHPYRNPMPTASKYKEA